MQALDHLFNGKSSSNKSVLDQLKVTRTNLAGFYIKTCVTWHKVLILIDVQLSDSSSDEVAEAFCLGYRGEDAELKGQRNQLKDVPG